jgi:hypothetical protein
MRKRIRASAAAAVVALTISLIAFGGTPGAVATQGQPVVAGATNTETNSTGFSEDSYSGSCPAFFNVGIVACGQDGAEFDANILGVHATGDTAIEGDGGTTGVIGQGPTGVEGDATGSKNGVYGHANNSGGSGVYGQNDGTGYGVAGRANNGTGVFGDSANATGVFGQGGENGVHAQGGTFGVFATGTDYGVYASGPAHGVFGQATTSGGAGVDAAGSGGALALRVTGKATFSRSGVVTIAAGTASLNVALAGVNAKSMILATAQQSASVSVKAAAPAVPSSGHFTIYLTGNAPAAGLKVAYFVLN